MKHLAVLCMSLIAFALHAQQQPVRLLTVGNSFANNALKYLERIAKEQGDTLIVGRANLGGCPLSRHWDNAEKDTPIYGKEKHTLKQMLEQDKWDVVTIQQVSHQSFKRESFEPYAEKLINYIKQYAPQAEIVVHQTWAYRADHPWFVKENADIDQRKMFSGALDNYLWLAEKYNLRIIPSGSAIQTCRETQPVKFTFPDPDFDYKNPESSKLPKQDGSLIVGWHWGKNKDEKPALKLDGIHANARGEYLIGCLWYEMLFKKNANDIKFVPDGITPEDAAFLRKTAHDTAVSFKQVKK